MLFPTIMINLCHLRSLGFCINIYHFLWFPYQYLPFLMVHLLVNSVLLRWLKSTALKAVYNISTPLKPFSAESPPNYNAHRALFISTDVIPVLAKRCESTANFFYTLMLHTVPLNRTTVALSSISVCVSVLHMRLRKATIHARSYWFVLLCLCVNTMECTASNSYIFFYIEWEFIIIWLAKYDDEIGDDDANAWKNFQMYFSYFGRKYWFELKMDRRSISR